MTSYISKFPSEMETFHCTWRTSFNIYFSVSLSGKLFCQSEKISFTINFRRYEVESCYGAVLRWRRNRMERPLSPPQIHQKNIWMLSKFHKTTSECWQRTSGTQKSSPLSSKGDSWHPPGGLQPEISSTEETHGTLETGTSTATQESE